MEQVLRVKCSAPKIRLGHLSQVGMKKQVLPRYINYFIIVHLFQGCRLLKQASAGV